MKKKKANRITTETYFRRYLHISPLAVALWRSVEAKHLSSVDLKHPILDIGCGFGEFAQAFFDEPCDVGLDTAPLDLYAAAKVNKYKNLILADARDMPFPKGTFSTIISISTLEHIPNPDKVLKESYRVLKPDGRIVFTIETTKVEDSSIYRPLFKNIGFPWLSNLYSKSFNKLFHRETLLPKEDWVKKIERTGFIIEKSEDIISPTITKLFDLFLITSWPSQILRPIVGRRFVYRPQFVNDLLVRIFLRYIEEPDKNGTNLFVIARKPRKKSMH